MAVINLCTHVTFFGFEYFFPSAFQRITTNSVIRLVYSFLDRRSIDRGWTQHKAQPIRLCDFVRFRQFARWGIFPHQALSEETGLPCFGGGGRFRVDRRRRWRSHAAEHGNKKSVIRIWNMIGLLKLGPDCPLHILFFKFYNAVSKQMRWDHYLKEDLINRNKR